MAEVDVQPIILKDCVVEIAGSDYAAAISSVIFTPSSTTVVFKGLKPASTHTDQTVPSWTCAITYAQDWDSAASLSKYLLANGGTKVEMTFKPKSAGTPSFAADVVITPGAIGGAVEQHATATVTLGVSGQPVPTYT